MFNNYPDAGQLSSKQLCKPDPEEVLKDIRERRASINEAQQLLAHLVELPIHFNTHAIEENAERTINAMAGELYFRSIQLEKQEEATLIEIDNS